MRTHKMMLPARIAYALEQLQAVGHQAYIVGGCVRDALMGKTPHDWDITTSAKPQEIKAVFSNHPQNDAGLKHGTVMVIIENEPVEITTFRIDGDYSDGRRPDSVVFTSDLTEDLARRDFTINACAYGREELIDPFGGISDLSHHLIRCVGDPNRRFTEDALRILRGLRFASCLGFQIEEGTKQAMFSCMALLKNISQERITIEFSKMLTGVHAKHILLEYHEFLVHVIPESADMIAFSSDEQKLQRNLYDHSVAAVDKIEPDLILRLTMLLHEIGKPARYSVDEQGTAHFDGYAEVSAQMAESILQRMRFSNQIIRDVTELIRYHDEVIPTTSAGVKKLLNKLGVSSFRRLLQVKEADARAHSPITGDLRLKDIQAVHQLLDSILTKNACTSLRDLALTGDDLIEQGVPQGVLLGQILNQLLSLVLEDRIANRKEVLLEKALSLYRELRE